MELKLSPKDAYYKLRHIIHSFSLTQLSSEEYCEIHLVQGIGTGGGGHVDTSLPMFCEQLVVRLTKETKI